MATIRSSVIEFAGTITQCVVGLSRLAALLFVLQLTMFAAIGPTSSTAGSGFDHGEASFGFQSSVIGSGSPTGEPASGLDSLIQSVDGLVQVGARLIVVIIIPLLCLLLLISPMVSQLESRHLFLALLTVGGLLPLILFDVASAPWAAGALPHLSNSLLIGGVVPLVATISMMSVAILLARRIRSDDIERMISSPAASRVTSGAGTIQMVGGKSDITSSQPRKRMQ
jgi:hypothetical protein